MAIALVLVATSFFAIFLGYFCHGVTYTEEAEENIFILSVVGTLTLLATLNLLMCIRWISTEFGIWTFIVPYMLYWLGKRWKSYRMHRPNPPEGLEAQ